MTNEEKIEKAKIALSEALEGKAIGGNERIVRRWGNAETIFNFAWMVEGANIERLQEAIIATNDPYWCDKFAEKIGCANIDMLQKVVLAQECVPSCIRFAKHKGADKQALANVVLAKGSKEQKEYFLASIKEGYDTFPFMLSIMFED